MKEEVTIETVKQFCEKLRKEKDDLTTKLHFVSTHKFEKEADFIREKRKTVNNILYELETLIEGKQSIDRVNFDL